jgi:predicted TIM-barrel fold metal-dependent hydrolase
VIVDVHTHTPTQRYPVSPGEKRFYDGWRPDRSVCVTNSWEDHQAAIRDVDAAIVFNIAVDDPDGATGIPADPATINDATAEYVAAHSDRLIGFMSVIPGRGRTLQEAERCLRELGLRGIKLGPNYQNFDPLSHEAHQLYAYASSHGLPILFHQGASPITAAPLRFAHPLVMDEIAIAHPELRVVMAHMGHPWQTDTIVVIRKHPHVFADVSALFYRPWSLYTCLRQAIEWNVAHKLLFGSDFPIATPAETMAGLRAVNEVISGTAMPSVPEDAIEAIIERDTLSLLGLGEVA